MVFCSGGGFCVGCLVLCGWFVCRTVVPSVLREQLLTKMAPSTFNLELVEPMDAFVVK